MDRIVLEQLSRSQIQALAKREGIKANMTTESMIARLLLQHPEGVPNLVSSDAAFRKSGRDGNATPVKSAAGKKRPRPLDLDNKTRRPPKFSRFAPAPSNRGTPDVRQVTPTPQPPPPNPSQKVVRRVRRAITTLVNAGATFPKSFEVDEKAFMRIRDRVEADLNMASEGLSDLTSIHVSVQDNLLRLMKDNRTLWDGTSDLPVAKQVLWKQLVEKIKREEAEELERIREERLRVVEDQGSESSDSTLDMGEFPPLPSRRKS